jgi:hypothetical protein
MRPTRPGSFIHLIVSLLSWSFCPPPAHSGTIDVAALVAACAIRNAGKPFANAWLASDNDVLCFDGRIRPSVPLDDIRKLNSGGTFVARSPGGNVIVAMLIADILKEKNATVVVHDYCLSACANAFLVASHQTHVAPGTIVAWHGGGTINLPCPPAPEYLRQDVSAAKKQDHIESYEMYCLDPERFRTFYQRRGIKDDFARRPQTHYSRRMVAVMLREAYDKRAIFWMWHPKNFGSYFKSKIVFQSFPGSQEEVDGRLRRLGLPMRAVYDPPPDRSE